MPEARKLIYILNSYSNTESSHFHHVIGLLEALAARDIVITLVIEKADAVPAFASHNINVIALKHRNGIRRLSELFGTIVSLIRRGYSRTYVRIAAPAALTAIFAHRLFGGEVFFWQSGTTIEYDLQQPLSLRKARWFLTSYLPNVAARRFTHHFVTGPSFMVDYYARVAGVSRDKIMMLYNDIDVKRFAPIAQGTEARARFLTDHGFRGNELLLLVVHRLSPIRKTLLYFPLFITHLRDVGLLERVVLVVAGAGSELPAIKFQAKEQRISDHCIFLGSVPNREIEHLYSMADIFLHPTYNEGFPRVVLEAMASGLPIVSTDAGGTSELLGPEQQRYVVSRDEPTAFASALEVLIRDAAVRKFLGAENLAHVQCFSTQNVAVMYEKALFS